MKKIKTKNKKINIFKRISNNIKDFYYKHIIKNKTKLNLKESLFLMLITFGIGMIIGGIIMYGKGPFGSSNNSLNEFIATYNELNDFYYQDVDSKKLLESGIKGMVGYLGDPYSQYMGEESAEIFSEDVEGVYSGIGAEIRLTEDKVYIGEVFEDSPAYKAGLKTNDILLKVNDKSIEGMTLDKIASTVKGEIGTTVKITVLRDDKEIDFTIKRGTVDNKSVTSEIIERDNKKIGYIYISIFAANTDEQFTKELKKLEDQKIDSLIIDLRNNQGGYLASVTDIISLFIGKGLPIYQLKTKEDIEIIYDKTNDKRNYKIAVLVNSTSASASEVLTAALKESYGATIIGTKTFGKGKVQKMRTLSNGAIVKYTYQEWLTPIGNYIDGTGITPDIEIKYVYDGNIDNQKEEAIKVLLNK